MITVKFEDVGRDKKSWTETIPELSQRNLTKAVHRHRAIASHHPDFEMLDETNGVIIAGFRTVGKFTIS